MAKITLENQYGTYIVEKKLEDQNIQEFLEEFIIPLLLAAGYNQETIDSYFNEPVS